MKLADIKERVNKFAKRKKKGKKLNPNKIEKVLKKLEHKQIRLKKELADAKAKDARHKAENKLKVVNAQIGKAKRLLQ